MEGVSFIARTAARKLEKQHGEGRSEQGVFVVPIAIRYLFKGNIASTVSPVLSDIERRLTWRTQALSLFPRDYVASNPTVDRMLETVERMSENLSGKEQVHPPMKVIVQVGEPFPVAGKRDRGADGDPVLSELEHLLSEMLMELSKESACYEGKTS